MTDCSYRSCIRCTTFTCLITEQTSLDTLYYCNAKNSASSLIESESILYNGKQNLWQTGDIPNNNTYSYQKINDSHHRNHGRRELSHSMDATEDDEQGEYCEGNSHGGRFDAKSLLPCQTDSIALHRIIGKAEGNDHQHGKKNTHPSFSQTILHIIGRSAIERCFAFPLVKLGES